MHNLKVERIEGIYTICTDKNQAYFAIETSELPEPLTVGTEFSISDDGEIILNK